MNTYMVRFRDDTVQVIKADFFYTMPEEGLVAFAKTKAGNDLLTAVAAIAEVQSVVLSEEAQR